MRPEIAIRKDEITAICRRHGVARLEIFGSAARGDDFDLEASDIDFWVIFQPPLHPGIFDRHFGLLNDLESLLGRDIDLAVGENCITNPFVLASINKDRELIYES